MVMFDNGTCRERNIRSKCSATILAVIVAGKILTHSQLNRSS